MNGIFNYVKDQDNNIILKRLFENLNKTHFKNKVKIFRVEEDRVFIKSNNSLDNSNIGLKSIRVMFKNIKKINDREWDDIIEIFLFDENLIKISY